MLYLAKHINCGNLACFKAQRLLGCSLWGKHATLSTHQQSLELGLYEGFVLQKSDIQCQEKLPIILRIICYVLYVVTHASTFCKDFMSSTKTAFLQAHIFMYSLNQCRIISAGLVPIELRYCLQGICNPALPVLDCIEERPTK